MRTTDQLRRLAARLRNAERQLLGVAIALGDAELPLVAKDIRGYARGCGILAITLDLRATAQRDPRGAPSQVQTAGEPK